MTPVPFLVPSPFWFASEMTPVPFSVRSPLFGSLEDGGIFGAVFPGDGDVIVEIDVQMIVESM